MHFRKIPRLHLFDSQLAPLSATTGTIRLISGYARSRGLSHRHQATAPWTIVAFNIFATLGFLLASGARVCVGKYFQTLARNRSIADLTRNSFSPIGTLVQILHYQSDLPTIAANKSMCRLAKEFVDHHFIRFGFSF